MPLYEYLCDACAHRFEVIQKYSDAPIDVCPKCGGVVKKLLSSPAIQFKGSGWYITDYAKSGKSDTGTVAANKGESAEKGQPSAASPQPSADSKSGDNKSSDSKSADSKPAESKSTDSKKSTEG